MDRGALSYRSPEEVQQRQAGAGNDRGRQVALRGHRRWRGRGGNLSDQAAGRPRGGRDGARRRRRPRRHLVLEPLSGRPLRLRELHLRLFILEGTARGVALEGTVLGPAGEPALSELRRRQIRPTQIHAVQLQGRGGAFRRGARSVAAHDQRRPRTDLPLRHHGGRSAFGADAAAAGGDGQFQGTLVPHLLLAARAGRYGRQEGRGHRHRRHRHSDHRRDRRQGRRIDGVPAAAELERAAQQQPDLERGDGRYPRTLRRDLRDLRPHSRRLRARARSPRLLRGDARGAAGAVGQAL